MAELPTNSVISYGAYTFPSNVETTSISIVPQYDAAGRTVIYNRIKLSLRAVLTGFAIDAAVRAVAQVLTKPAYPFRYVGSGYGLVVNVGGVRDVVWGPKPLDASVKPLGGGHAAELTWTVEVCIPDGPSARYDLAPMEFYFTLAYDVDASGYTTRTYEATVRIPQTRAFPTARTIQDSADRLLEQITPALLPGFRRVPGGHTLSPDKCSLTAYCTDVQMPPNVPPAGVVDCAASHSLSSTPGNWQMWSGTLEASYEIARNGVATVAVARDAFFALAKDRINHTIDTISRAEPVELRTGGADGRRNRPTVIPVSFTMTEPEIYGRTKARFSLSYRVVGANLKTMLQASGMWRPVPGTNWFTWAESMGPVIGPRGHAGLIFSPNDDRIVDLLQPVPPNLGLLGSLNSRGAGATAIPAGVFPDPTPEQSWISYTCAVFVETANGVVRVTGLPTKPREAAGDVYGPASQAAAGIATGIVAGIWDAGAATSPFFFPPPRQAAQQNDGGTDKKQSPQRRARQTSVLWMIGHALRVKYAIPAPTADKWGDATLTPANRQDRGEGFWSAVVGNVIWPVTAAKWRLRYEMDTVPAAGAPVLPNPLLGGGGAEAANLPATLGTAIGGGIAAALGQAVGGVVPGGG